VRQPLGSRALALAVFALLGVPLSPARAQSLEVVGYAGVLGEWEVTATITAGSSWWWREFSGPLTMRHVGLCTQSGPEQKTGELQLRLSASHVYGTLAVAGDACTLSARLSDAYKGVLTCPGGRTTPLTLWLKDLNADAKAADAPG
jgi:hypothetical protein